MTILGELETSKEFIVCLNVSVQSALHVSFDYVTEACFLYFSNTTAPANKHTQQVLLLCNSGVPAPEMLSYYLSWFVLFNRL